MNYKNVFSVIALIPLTVSMISCGSDSENSASCTPLSPSSFPCVDSDQCLSVTATWCFPGASSCTNMDADLTLSHPMGFTIDSTFTPGSNINDCIHDGDETAPGITGPFNENITCSPYVHAMPPNRLDAGTYTASINALSIHSGTPVLLDINVDGVASCQIIATGINPVTTNIVYP